MFVVYNVTEVTLNVINLAHLRNDRLDQSTINNHCQFSLSFAQWKLRYSFCPEGGYKPMQVWYEISTHPSKKGDKRRHFRKTPVFYGRPTRLSFFSHIMADRFNKVCESATFNLFITWRING